MIRFLMPAALVALLLTSVAAIAQSQRQDTPTQFDFYVLSLSWSPSFCAAAAERRMLLIRTEIRGDNIAVAVEDTGPGIDRDQLGDIFTAFVTTKSHGMGLGLAISRMIIDYHGGKLTATSDSKHGGASFQFVLPTANRH